MTTATWNTLVSAIRSIQNPPAWLNKYSHMTYTEIERLPELDYVGNGMVAAPSVDENVLKSDYIDFLRDQIRIDARGPEWKKTLEQRLDALVPFVGRNIITVSLYQKPDSAILRIDPETGRLFHAEF